MTGPTIKVVGRGARWRYAAAMLFAHSWPALAHEGGPVTSVESESHTESGNAVDLGAAYFSDVFANLHGGIARGATYQARFGVLLDVDLDKLVGWRGALFHASVHQIHGTPITPAKVSALNAVTGLEADPNTRLNNLWIEQELGDSFNVRVGQFTAAQEFLISDAASLFVNSTFGWPTSAAQNLPSGGPAYPIATPGARLRLGDGRKTTLLFAVFNGDPAGPGDGDPQQRDARGLNSLRVSGPPFLIAELQHKLGRDLDDPVTTLRVGAWSYLGKVLAQRLIADDFPLAGSGTDEPAERTGNYQLYAIVDRRLLRSESQTVMGFFRVTFSPSDRNLVDASLDAGLTLKGPLAKRSDDSLGLAFSYTHLSRGPDERSGRAGQRSGKRRAETVVELTYHAQLSANWYLQPDVQVIIHPGGRFLDPHPGFNIPPRSAIIVGLRNVIRL